MPIGSKTYESVQNRILSRVDKNIAPDSELKTKILNEVNFQISQLYGGLKGEIKDKYLKESTVTWTNNLFDMATLSDFSDFHSLRENAYGDITSVPPDKLENLFTLLYYDNSFVCAVYGEILKLFVGGNLSISGRTFLLKYYRLPAVILTTTDIIDFPDNFVEDIINNVLATLSGKQSKDNKAE